MPPRPFPKDHEAAMGYAWLSHRPKLTLHIGEIAALWTEIDTLLGTEIALLLGIDAKIGIAMFVEIESEGSKLAMIRGLARLIMDKPDQEELLKLLREIREKRSKRNDVVHGIWGICNTLPDDLVWHDPRDALHFTAEITAGDHIDKGPVISFPKEKFLLYSEKEFDEIKREGWDLRLRIQSFGGKLLTKYGIPRLTRAQR